MLTWIPRMLRRLTFICNAWLQMRLEPAETGMLREINNAALQRNGKLRQRWFVSACFDLVVWYGDSDAIVGFELCYGKPRIKKSLRWSEHEGYAHFRIDHGEPEPLTPKMTPLHVPDAMFDKERVLHAFIAASTMIDSITRDAVIERIRSYSCEGQTRGSAPTG
jgi:hypothetical protein